MTGWRVGYTVAPPAVIDEMEKLMEHMVSSVIAVAQRAALADIEGLQRAVELYRGDFLEGFSLRDSASFDDWQMFEAEGLRLDLADALERLVQGHAALAAEVAAGLAGPQEPEAIRRGHASFADLRAAQRAAVVSGRLEQAFDRGRGAEPAVGQEILHRVGGVLVFDEVTELGTVPLAPDGSFAVEVPADTAIAFQAVDARAPLAAALGRLRRVAHPGSLVFLLSCQVFPFIGITGMII